jgi:hypothetical protein
VPIREEAGWAPGTRKKRTFVLLGVEPQSSSCPVHCLVTMVLLECGSDTILAGMWVVSGSGFNMGDHPMNRSTVLKIVAS